MTHWCRPAAVLVACAAVWPAQADEISDFYTAKAVSIYIAGAGGSYGVHGRAVADHLGRMLPGTPTVVPQFMPGAGGLKAANFVYNAAAKDGTAVGLLIKYIALDQAIGQSGIKYDVRKFEYLISTGPINSVLAIWHKAPATTVEGMKKVELLLGSTGKSSETYITPMLMNAFLGTKFRVITGYKGMTIVHLAMEQGEVHGRAAAWENLLADRPQWAKSKDVALVAQSGLYRDRDLPDVPTVVELAPDAESRAALEFVGAGSTIGRLYLAPPGVPAARVAALRAAFGLLVKDEKFLADAKRFKMNIDPRPAADIKAMSVKVVESPTSVIERTKRAIQ